MKAGNIEIIDTSYMEYPADIYTVRWRVFVEEQGIDGSLVMDDRDYASEHVVALQGKAKEPIGAARIDLEQQGKIGRVAVLDEMRGQGLGRRMLKNLERIAQRANLKQVWCHVQESAIPFYQRNGYRIEGDAFLEADITHYKMTKLL